MSGAHATGAVMPIALDNGNQNTEKPYAMPMHKWMANAAGGTSQRLKPGLAMIRSLDRNPGWAPAPLPERLLLILKPPLIFVVQPACTQIRPHSSCALAIECFIGSIWQIAT
jgi:hypothetical protein